MDDTYDTILYKKLKAGNRQALEILYKSYYSRLCLFARRYIEEEEIVQDIIQDSFLKLWEKRDLIQTDSLKSLLFSIVRHQCLDYLRHQEVIGKYDSYIQGRLDGEERLFYADFMCEPECKLLYQELQEEIQKIVENLPEQCRKVFLLSRFDDLKNREIARRLNISQSAVEKTHTACLNVFSQSL